MATASSATTSAANLAGLRFARHWSTSDINLPVVLLNQLFWPQCAGRGGRVHGLLIFANLPAIPLLTRRRLHRTGHSAQQLREAGRQTAGAGGPGRSQAGTAARDRIEEFLAVDPMEIVIGLGLIRWRRPSTAATCSNGSPACGSRLQPTSASSCPRCIRDDFRLSRNVTRSRSTT